MSVPTTITLSGNRRIWLNIVQGIVIEASESSVAVVYQGRDQRQVIGGTSIVRPGRLHSEVVSINKVWIRTDAGQDAAYDLSDFAVDVRVGHQLMLVYGAAEGVAEGAFFGAMNTTTGKYAFDESIHCDRLRPFGLYLPAKFYRKRAMWGVVIGVSIGVVCTFLGAKDSSFIVAGAIFGFILSWPVALVQGVIRQLQGQRLVPKLNHFALVHLISKSLP